MEIGFRLSQPISHMRQSDNEILEEEEWDPGCTGDSSPHLPNCHYNYLSPLIRIRDSFWKGEIPLHTETCYPGYDP